MLHNHIKEGLIEVASSSSPCLMHNRCDYYPHPQPTMKPAILLLLSWVLVVASGRPISQDDDLDPDSSRWRTAFPKTTTPSTMNTTTAETRDVTPTSSSSSLSRIADAFEIAGSVVGLLVFFAGAVVAVKKFRDELRRNPGEIAEALERLGQSLRALLHRRRQ